MISEDVFNDDENKLRYNNFVKFGDYINEDLSNIDKFIEFIEFNLIDTTYENNKNQLINNKSLSREDCLYYLYNNLLSFDNQFINFNNIVIEKNKLTESTYYNFDLQNTNQRIGNSTGNENNITISNELLLNNGNIRMGLSRLSFSLDQYVKMTSESHNFGNSEITRVLDIQDLRDNIKNQMI